MNWKFNTRRFIKTLAAYAVLIIVLDISLTYFFDISEPKQSIFEVFGAIIIFQVIEELYRRYKARVS